MTPPKSEEELATERRQTAAYLRLLAGSVDRGEVSSLEVKVAFDLSLTSGTGKAFTLENVRPSEAHVVRPEETR